MEEKIFGEFYILVDEAYTKEPLEGFYKAFLQDFILKNNTLCRSYRVPVTTVESKRALKKPELLEVIVPFFVYGELFRAMKAALPPAVAAIYEKVILEGAQNHLDLEKEFGLVVHLPSNYSGYYQPPRKPVPLLSLLRCGSYNLESNWNSSQISVLKFPDEIRSQLRKFIPAPADELPVTTDVPEKLTVYRDDNGFFADTPYILDYCETQDIHSRKITAASYNKIKNQGNVSEFYTDSTAPREEISLRTRLLIHLVDSARKLLRKEAQSQDAIMKGIFKLYVEGAISSVPLLFHLRNADHQPDYSKIAHKNIVNILKKLPLLKWAKVEDLLRFSYRQDMEINPIPVSPGTNVNFEGLRSRFAINPGTYRRLVTEPAMKASLFMFATLGWLDIAYEAPQARKTGVYEAPVISFFDGVRYVRLTDLGAYMLGLIPVYSFAPLAADEDLVLDENRLMLTYAGKNKRILAGLGQLAQPLNETVYKISVETLMEGCKKVGDFEAKMRILEGILPAEKPEIWQTFLEEMDQRTYELAEVTERYRIFQLPDDKELIRLIARDEFLHQHVLKAEQYHVLISVKHVEKVKNHLKKHGFLVDFLLD